MSGTFDNDDMLIPTEDFNTSPGGLTPLRIGLIIGAVGLVVTLGLAWFQLRPLLQEIATVEGDINTKDAQLTAANNRIEQLEGVEERIEQARLVSVAVSTFLPTPQNLQTQLLELSRLINISMGATSGTTELRSFTPTVPVPAGAEVPEAIQAQIFRSTAEVSFQGTFAEAVSLMESIEQLETLLQVRNVSISTLVDDDGRVLPVLSGSFQLEAFIYDSTYVPPEPEVDPDADPEAVPATEGEAAE